MAQMKIGNGRPLTEKKLCRKSLKKLLWRRNICLAGRIGIPRVAARPLCLAAAALWRYREKAHRRLFSAMPENHFIMAPRLRHYRKAIAEA